MGGLLLAAEAAVVVVLLLLESWCAALLTTVEVARTRFPLLEEVRQSATPSYSTLEKFVVTEPCTVATALAAHFRVSKPYATELVDIGAVYTAEADCAKWQRCFDPSRKVHPGVSIKAYRLPARFPAACEADWDERILYSSEDWGIVVDKPAMVPVQPHASNTFESLPSVVAKTLGLPHLYIAHRLDVCTSGLVVLAPSPLAQSRLVATFTNRAVDKRYIALVTSPVEKGLLSHWVDSKARGMTQEIFAAQTQEQASWKKCEICILDCTQAPKGTAKQFGHSSTTESYLVQMALLTGRKHQIRAQLAAIGSPILGDTLYGGGKGCRPPTSEIALQACSIDFLDGKKFQARKPRWAAGASVGNC
jgi:23S rRNA-/tRNA-specific pseudouridylate synthase